LEQGRTDQGIHHGRQLRVGGGIPDGMVNSIDHSVHPLMPVVGYRGCLRLIEQISDALLERRDRDAADEDFELVL